MNKTAEQKILEHIDFLRAMWQDPANEMDGLHVFTQLRENVQEIFTQFQSSPKWVNASQRLPIFSHRTISRFIHTQTPLFDVQDFLLKNPDKATLVEWLDETTGNVSPHPSENVIPVSALEDKGFVTWLLKEAEVVPQDATDNFFYDNCWNTFNEMYKRYCVLSPVVKEEEKNASDSFCTGKRFMDNYSAIPAPTPSPEEQDKPKLDALIVVAMPGMREQFEKKNIEGMWDLWQMIVEANNTKQDKEVKERKLCDHHPATEVGKYYTECPKCGFLAIELQPPLPIADINKMAEQCFENLKALNPKGGMKEFIRMAFNAGYTAKQI